MDEKEKYNALLTRNADYDGNFHYGVKTTKIVSRPSCRARIPKIKNAILFSDLQTAIANGFRPCKICIKELYKLCTTQVCTTRP